MNHVVIGRKELFAFAERYAGKKVKDYRALEDGEVVALLLSRIFPSHRIVPASSETSSFSQRCQYNWELIFRYCARFHIPAVLLCAPSFGDSNNCCVSRSLDIGFPTLAFLYFLFHLSKKPDFSAEFSEDVPEEIMEYLQSFDSIASLLLGDAMDWKALPPEVAEEIKTFPAFHSSTAQKSLDEKEAVKLCRSFLGRNSKTNTEGKGKPQETSSREKKEENEKKQEHQSEDKDNIYYSEMSSTKHSSHSTRDPLANTSGVNVEMVPSKRPSSSRHAVPSPDNKSLSFSTPATADALNSAWERERQLLFQLALKTEECETLQRREVEWVEKIRAFSFSGGKSLSEEEGKKCTEEMGRKETTFEDPHPESTRLSEFYRLLYEKEREKRVALEAKWSSMLQMDGHHGNAGSQGDPLIPATSHSTSSRDTKRLELSQKVEALLDDVRDPETKEFIYPHSVAHTLQEWISSLSLSGTNTKETQQTLLSLLRCLWTGYSEVEKRLVNAVDLLDSKLEEYQIVERTSTTSEKAQNKRDSSSFSPYSVSRSSSEENSMQKDAEILDGDRKHSVVALEKMKEDVEEIEKGVHMLFTTACQREEQWRTLCGKLYQVEKITSTIAERMEMKKASEREIREAVVARKTHYAEIEHLTDLLLRLPSSAPSRKKESEEYHFSIDDIMSSLSESFSRLRGVLHVQ